MDIFTMNRETAERVVERTYQGIGGIAGGALGYIVGGNVSGTVSGSRAGWSLGGDRYRREREAARRHG